MLRGLLLVDGPSDAPLSLHVERLARRHGIALDVVAPDLRRFDPRPGLRVTDRLTAVLRLDDAFDVVFVHRDAEGQSPAQRRSEIEQSVNEISPALRRVPIVPVRMTEAWLLTDEAAIRRVAGRPHATAPLDLPILTAVDGVADPKAVLKRALLAASGCTGRRRNRFVRDFPAHRRMLLEGLDHSGPVTDLEAWRMLEADIVAALGASADGT